MVDANIILAFYNDYREKKGQIYDLIIWIISDIGIAINSHISTEWKETCSADVFLAWYIDQLKLGTIRNVVCDNLPHHLVKKMVQDHGFPA